MSDVDLTVMQNTTDCKSEEYKTRMSEVARGIITKNEFQETEEMARHVCDNTVLHPQ